MKDKKFSYYEGGIFKTTPTKEIFAHDFQDLLKNNEHIELIKQIRSEKDKEKRDKLKRELSYVTFAGTFSKRGKDNLIQSSGLACFDIDDVENISKVKSEVIKNKFTHFCFDSPSGKGFKFLVKIPKVESNEEYKTYWSSIARHYNIPDNDEGTKDISRACYISFDEDPYFLYNPKVYTKTIRDKNDSKYIGESQQEQPPIKQKEIKDTSEIDKEYFDKNVIPQMNEEIQELILKGSVKGDRSEADMKVINNLILKGFGDYIKQIFSIYPCGEKSQSRGDDYLDMCISKAEGYTGITDYNIPRLENELNKIDDKILKNKINEYLVRISEIKDDLQRKHFISHIAFRTGIKSKDIEKKLKELKERNEIKNPIPISEILGKPLPKIEYYCKPLLPKNFVILLGGRTSHFKTNLLLYLLLSIKQNKSFLGQFPIEDNPKILYFDIENGEETLHPRFRYMLNGLGVKPNEIKDTLKGFDVLYDFNKQNMDLEIEKAKKYDVIVLDSYRRFLNGTENDSELTNKFFTDFVKPLKELGKTIVIMHHFRKGNMEEITDEAIVEQFRGSSDITSQFDLVFAVIKNNEKYDSINDCTKLDISVVKGKNRKGIPFQNFSFKVLKDDKNKTSTFKFTDFGKIKTPKQNTKDRIVQIVKERGKVQRKEIITEVLKDFDISDESIIKYLYELEKTDRILKRTKFGIYELLEAIWEKDASQKELKFEDKGNE